MLFWPVFSPRHIYETKLFIINLVQFMQPLILSSSLFFKKINYGTAGFIREIRIFLRGVNNPLSHPILYEKSSEILIHYRLSAFKLHPLGGGVELSLSALPVSVYVCSALHNL